MVVSEGPVANVHVDIWEDFTAFSCCEILEASASKSNWKYNIKVMIVSQGRISHS
jgi:hypothetical protein